MREPLTVGSLFSGLGSFDHGLELAGCRTIWQVEIEPACVAVLARHWPEVMRYGDITQIDPATLPVPDIIVGGFPCQDLSVAGHRKGLAGERSGLWYEFHRILRGCHSRWVIVENVDGLLSSSHGDDFAIVLGGLTGILPRVPAGGWQSGGFARGPFYHVAWRVLDAEYFGVAQRRNRVFFVGHIGDGRAAEVLFESVSVSWHPPARRETGQDVAATLTYGSHIGSSAPGRRREDDINLIPSVDATLGSNAAGGHRGDLDSAGAYIPELAYALTTKAAPDRPESRAATLVAFTNRGFDTGTVGETLRAAAHGALPLVAHALTSEGADASEDGTGRGVPLVVEPLGFDLAQITSAANGSRVDGELPMPPLAATGQPMVAREVAPALTGNYGKQPDNSDTALGPALAVAFRGRDGGLTAEVGDDVANALRSAEGTGSRPYSLVGPEWAVRQLTPRECERLQGLEDDWSRWGATGKEISDSARYRMIGNAGCCNILTWIGRRIIASLS